MGVVLVDGDIVDGPSQELPFGIGGVAGADTLLSALEQCRADSTSVAVVLRVNSPGGSALASDGSRARMVRVRAAGKPVIVSMGDMAASGGYYMAAPADRSSPSPTTITGSIGIFAFKVDVAQLLATVGLARDLPARRPRRLFALSALDRGGG